MSTPIRVQDDVKSDLNKIGNTSDTYNSVIKKLLTFYKTSGGIK